MSVPENTYIKLSDDDINMLKKILSLEKKLNFLMVNYVE